ncbi:bestrophin family protein [Taibaiella soli]|uniref:Bestrophin n=1 Tax=Taibaiella soli TaxID=1649169 RepID=A0A2W2BN39_9BACT|nr:bestrophin family ion channel [Taibaiella soli]PZF74886.1 hypothetical protein DN068_01430 [Taibaiella soli]
MLLRQGLTTYRFFKITWKLDLLMIGLCTAAYFTDTYLLPKMVVPATLPTLIGTAIAFFIAFNNNQAYSRWWEARTIWGALVNDSRSWARNILTYCNTDTSFDDTELKKLQRKMVFRHIGFLYALKAALRKIPSDEFAKYLTDEDAKKVTGYANIPSAILDLQAADLQLLSEKGVVDGFRFMQMNGMITNFCDSMGKSERINNTVFPTTYVYFTRLFIWILVILVTMAISEHIGWPSIFFGWIIGFVFHTTHINGMSIMNPFELQPAGISLNSITRTIEINLLQMLGDGAIPEPVKAERNGEYIL